MSIIDILTDRNLSELAVPIKTANFGSHVWAKIFKVLSTVWLQEYIITQKLGDTELLCNTLMLKKFILMKLKLFTTHFFSSLRITWPYSLGVERAKGRGNEEPTEPPISARAKYLTHHKKRRQKPEREVKFHWLCYSVTKKGGQFLPIKLLKIYQRTTRALFQPLSKPCYRWQLDHEIRHRNGLPISEHKIL